MISSCSRASLVRYAGDNVQSISENDERFGLFKDVFSIFNITYGFLPDHECEDNVSFTKDGSTCQNGKSVISDKD